MLPRLAEPHPIPANLLARQSLERELDFVREARNGARSAFEFRGRSDVHVPAVRWDLTTQRVLTTEFIHGSKVSVAGRQAGRHPPAHPPAHPPPTASDLGR